MRRPWIVPIAAILLGWNARATSPQQHQYGGWRNLKGSKTGFFHAERIKGRWGLLTPELPRAVPVAADPFVTP
jgi:hypothetical protein